MVERDSGSPDEVLVAHARRFGYVDHVQGHTPLLVAKTIDLMGVADALDSNASKSAIATFIAASLW